MLETLGTVLFVGLLLIFPGINIPVAIYVGQLYGGEIGSVIGFIYGITMTGMSMWEMSKVFRRRA